MNVWTFFNLEERNWRLSNRELYTPLDTRLVAISGLLLNVPPWIATLDLENITSPVLGSIVAFPLSNWLCGRRCTEPGLNSWYCHYGGQDWHQCQIQKQNEKCLLTPWNNFNNVGHRKKRYYTYSSTEVHGVLHHAGLAMIGRQINFEQSSLALHMMQPRFAELADGNWIIYQ